MVAEKPHLISALRPALGAGLSSLLDDVGKLALGWMSARWSQDRFLDRSAKEWDSQLAGRRVKHRTVTHYVAAWAFGLVFGLVVWDWHFALAAFCGGGLSHVLCDALTVNGVPLGWWSDRRFHLFGGRFRTGQLGEYWFAGAFVLACVGLATITRHWGDGGFTPFFWDWADYYKSGLIDGHEWKEKRFKWL